MNKKWILSTLLGAFLGSFFGLLLSNNQDFTETLFLAIVAFIALPFNITAGYIITIEFFNLVDIIIVTLGLIGFLISTYKYKKESKSILLIFIVFFAGMLCFKSAFAFAVLMSV